MSLGDNVNAVLLRGTLLEHLKQAKVCLGEIIRSGEIVTPERAMAAADLWKAIEKAQTTFNKGLGQLAFPGESQSEF